MPFINFLTFLDQVFANISSVYSSWQSRRSLRKSEEGGIQHHKTLAIHQLKQQIVRCFIQRQWINFVYFLADSPFLIRLFTFFYYCFYSSNDRSNSEMCCYNNFAGVSQLPNLTSYDMNYFQSKPRFKYKNAVRAITKSFTKDHGLSIVWNACYTLLL